MFLKPQQSARLAAAALAIVAAMGVARLSVLGFAPITTPPVYHSTPVPTALQEDFVRKGYKLDVQSGNYLHPRLNAKTFHEAMLPIMIDGRYIRDVRGQTMFLRQTIRDKIEQADAEMFKHKGQHLKIVYGFRPNYVQAELFDKLNGHGKVAPAGMSYHETGMAVDLQNWREAQRYMIEAGFVGGCFGMEEDMVHYSIGELTKVSNFEEWKRCTLKDLPKDVKQDTEKVGKGFEKVGGFITNGHFPGTRKTP